jgi:hypothetical protein
MEHSRVATVLTSGLAALPRCGSSAFASTQAAWRFFRNPDVTLPQLIAPLHQAAHTALETCPLDYALVVIDWSTLNYHTHSAKADQILFSSGSDRGYDLAAALLVDTFQGDPLSLLELRLRTAKTVYSTRLPASSKSASHLDQVLRTMQAVRRLNLPTRPVYVVDCEGDSVDHLRQWAKGGHLFLVRTDGTRKARWQQQEFTLHQIGALLEQQQAFRSSRPVQYHGRAATQTVTEVEIVLERPGYRGKGKQRRVVKGKPLKVRLVISRVHDETGKVVATWYLLSNVPTEITTADVALWYYWRWRIESYFKLLKSGGQQVEAWQQQSAEAIAKRLLVASMACALVWQVAYSAAEGIQPLRELLIRLSGRQMKYGVEFTLPALLAGMWVLVAMLEVLQEVGVEELRRLAEPLRRLNPTTPPKNTG